VSAGNSWLAARNLLAVRLDNAGDVVMLGPALRAIKSASPECRITLLASPAGQGGAAPALDRLGARVEIDLARSRAASI